MRTLFFTNALKVVSGLTLSFALLVPAASQAAPVLKNLRTGVYQCGACSVSVQQLGREIIVSPGVGCGDRGQTNTFNRTSAVSNYYSRSYVGTRYETIGYTLYKYYEAQTSTMKLLSNESYIFRGPRTQLLCVKN